MGKTRKEELESLITVQSEVVDMAIENELNTDDIWKEINRLTELKIELHDLS